MTTDKPKWWQSWIVYALIGLLLTLGPYVGGYFLLGPSESLALSPITFREYEYETLRIAFGPLGWAEAKLRGERVVISNRNEFLECPLPGDIDDYEPGW
ncbi:hypothetical protein CA54_47030 [Symmachiella macrocystis]|uniref:Uncharacterized protein n=1 Tax=Symmachiella macrocystis TaxID=2527985 RepID=A0A5C6BD72_9PLAN|nr:hypothetical protein [Symmachiella macrocystis]TWU09461.1 hypothetical protein CA54_47030 [Symmachiella macrocystis]